MDEQQLVATIVAEITKQLGLGHQLTKTVVIGPNQTKYPSLTPELCQESWEEVLITQLSPSDLGQLALGLGQGYANQFILEALLLGKKVYLLRDALIYRQYQGTSPQSLYERYAGYETQLIGFGVRLIDQLGEMFTPPEGTVQKTSHQIKGKLLTGAMVQKLAEQGIKDLDLAHNTLITPQAADFLKDHKISVARLI